MCVYSDRRLCHQVVGGSGYTSVFTVLVRWKIFFIVLIGILSCYQRFREACLWRTNCGLV